MSISSYSDLVARVAAWLNRDDLATEIPTFIALCEAELNRRLRAPAMEVAATISASDEATTLPTDCREIRSLWTTGTYNVELKPISMSDIARNYTGLSGVPESYAVSGGVLYLAPPPAAFTTLRLTYYQAIPSLSETGPSNWLLQMHPDAYLYGTLLAAEAFGFNDDRLPVWSGAFENVIDGISREGARARYGTAPRMASPVVPINGVRA